MTDTEVAVWWWAYCEALDEDTRQVAERAKAKAGRISGRNPLWTDP